jgi:hypothetical protein
MGKCPDCKGPYKLWNDYDNCVEFYECGWCHKREKIRDEYPQRELSDKEEILYLIVCVFGIITITYCFIHAVYNFLHS